jgi:hypothetical protein
MLLRSTLTALEFRTRGASAALAEPSPAPTSSTPRRFRSPAVLASFPDGPWEIRVASWASAAFSAAFPTHRRRLLLCYHRFSRAACPAAFSFCSRSLGAQCQDMIGTTVATWIIPVPEPFSIPRRSWLRCAAIFTAVFANLDRLVIPVNNQSVCRGLFRRESPLYRKLGSRSTPCSIR